MAHIKATGKDSGLYQAIATLEDADEVYRFFQDLCTVQELRDFELRFELASLLSQKKIYNEILELTGASTATISRVNRTLTYGHGGYRAYFDRQKQQAQEETPGDGE